MRAFGAGSSSSRSYIQKHQLAIQVDKLIGALLTVKPEDPAHYFQDFHRGLQDAYPERYEQYLKNQAIGRQAGGFTTLDQDCHSCPSTPDTHRIEVVPHRGINGVAREKVEGTDCKLYYADALPQGYQDIVSMSSKFDPTYPVVCNGRSFSLQNEVHWKLRLAALFLRKIGRDTRASDMEVKSAKGHYEYENQRKGWGMCGLPNVKLGRDLTCSCPMESIVISAQHLQASIDRASMQQCLEFVGHESQKPIGVSHCEEIYGEGEFKITYREVRTLAQSTKIYTGVDLPPLFWLRLVGITSRDSLIQYYNDRNAIPLAWMASQSPACPIGSWIKELLDNKQLQEHYGFQSEASFLQTIHQSMTELSTQVCIVQHGYFFSCADNQIAAKPRAPILFLSAPGIDFNSGSASRAEMSKYFVAQAFKPKGRTEFKARIKQTYNILFTACRDAGVTHPTAIGLGLGMFLPPIEQDAVKQIYHEAQFELLEEQDYGFDTYFLNPGPGTPAALKLLEQKTWAFKCQVMLHFREGKSFASQLACKGYRTSFLNPSDCIAVMQGCIGYWWETGMGERYVGEEDFAATSTAVLARVNICRIWSAYDNGWVEEYGKVKQVLLDGEQEEATVKGSKVKGCNTSGPRPRRCMRMYPEEVHEVENPEVAKGYEYVWADPLDGNRETRMKFYRILWLDSEKLHTLHIRPMINQMRQRGIVVDIAFSTEEALEKLQGSEVPLNFVLTSSVLETGPCNTEGDVDSGHVFLQQIQKRRCVQKYYFRTICAITNVINSRERSTLYSEGCDAIRFDFHSKTFDEVMGVLCRVQRYSDRLCNALRDWQSGHLKNKQVILNLIDFGIHPDFQPKGCAPLHFLASHAPGRDEEAREMIERLLPQDGSQQADPNIASRYTSSGIEKGSPPLLAALLHGNASAAKLLMDRGAVSSGLDDSLVQRMDSGSGNTEALVVRMRENLKRHESMREPPKPTAHDMLTVLWISSCDRLSERTTVVRHLIDSNPALGVQCLTCGVPEEHLESWIVETLYPFIEGNGTDQNAYFEHQREDLVWVQCIVLELNGQDRVNVWRRMIQAIKAHINVLRPKGAPWLKIVTYVDGLTASSLDHMLAQAVSDDIRVTTKQKKGQSDPEPATPLSPLQPLSPKAPGSPKMEQLSKVQSRSGSFRVHGVQSKLVFDNGSGDGLDPEAEGEPCAQGIKDFYRELRAAVVHWTWDADDISPLFPDKPYDAKTSARIERAYCSGAPSVWVTPKHKIIFRDMVQRLAKDPMKLRLVFRNPEPCFDCDAQVRKFPGMLRQIASGSCLVFIGAGFCMPTGAPSWGNLLRQIALRGVEEAKKDVQEAEGRGEVADGRKRTLQHRREVRDEVLSLVSAGSNHSNYELAAQLLEDSLKVSMKEYLADILKEKVPKGREILQRRNARNGEGLDMSFGNQATLSETNWEGVNLLSIGGGNGMDDDVMASRIELIQCLKFFSILTTNYSWELCICKEPYDGNGKEGCGVCRGCTPLSQGSKQPQFLDIVRKMPSGIIPMHQRPIVQLHGSVSDPKTIVLSREGYRELLHGNRNYNDFLKSVMMSRTILYIGFSFTDDYLNEVRSDVMAMRGATSKTKHLAYAIINNKSRSHCEYYDQHEGVKILTWNSGLYGYGMLDRYLGSILNMTDTSAALSGSKVVLFAPSDDRQGQSSSNDKLVKLQHELQNQRKKSLVHDVMPSDCYPPFQVTRADSIAEVEAALKKDDFLQSWVVTFADEGCDSISPMHYELINFLWHPHAQLNTEFYPPMLLVWGSPSHSTRGKAELSLKEQYERHLHVKFCRDMQEVFAAFHSQDPLAGAAEDALDD